MDSKCVELFLLPDVGGKQSSSAHCHIYLRRCILNLRRSILCVKWLRVYVALRPSWSLCLVDNRISLLRCYFKSLRNFVSLLACMFARSEKEVVAVVYFGLVYFDPCLAALAIGYSFPPLHSLHLELVFEPSDVSTSVEQTNLHISV